MRPVLAAAVALVVAAPALAATAPRGSLSQPRGSAGCVVDPTQHSARRGCATATGLSGTQNIALSPDQRTLYATSNFTWGMDVFARNRATGALHQIQCLASLARRGCTTVRGMTWAFWTAVSPDGRNVYVSGGIGNQIAVLRRSPATGRVTQLRGADACLHDTTGGTLRGGPTAAQSGCRLVSGLAYPRTITVDPSGRFLYAATFSGDQITAFARDPATGALSAAPGVCASSKRSRAARRCAHATALDGVTDLTISRDGRFAYAASLDSNGVDAFARDPQTGRLTEIGCMTEGATGGCARGRGLGGAYDLALSRDGRSLYVTARHSAAIAVLDRDPASGALTQPDGPAGCLAAKATDGCATARGLHGVRGVAVSADGADVYAGAFSDSAIAIFARDPSTGALTQLPGRAGCVASALAGCAHARAIAEAWAVTPSADGRFLYSGVSEDSGSGLAVFRRR